MKRVFSILFLGLLTLSVRGQVNTKIIPQLVFQDAHEQSLFMAGIVGHTAATQVLWGLDFQQDPLQNKRMQRFLKKMDKKRDKWSEAKFAQQLFYQTQFRFLKHYDLYHSVSETLNSGRYDCLSGTALLAWLLDHYHMRYTVIEMNYHVFLVVKGKEHHYLFESTDPLNGFMQGDDKIQEKVAAYVKSARQNPAIKGVGSREILHTTVVRFVGARQLVGLQYYNRAIKCFNAEDYVGAANAVEKGLVFYPSDRLQELYALSVRYIWESPGISEKIKEASAQKFASLSLK